MIKYQVNIEKMSLISFVKYFKIECLIFCFVSLILLAGAYFIDNRVVFQVTALFTVMQLSILTSMIIHEYAHVFVLKHFGVIEIQIQKSLFRVSIVTKKGMLNNKQNILVSIAGVSICTFTGICCIFLAQYISEYTLYLNAIAFVFCLHLFNLLPIFGDGKQILLSILNNAIMKGGEKNE